MKGSSTAALERVGALVRRHLPELLRYGSVGALNAALYLGLYAILVLAGVPYVVAAIVAFPPPVALGYWLHEHWTFARGEPRARWLLAFLVAQLAGLTLGVVALVVLVDGLHLDPIPARALSLPLSPALTYLASSTWIFKPRAPR